MTLKHLYVRRQITGWNQEIAQMRRLEPVAENQMLLRAETAEALEQVARHLRAENYFLLLVTATDERNLTEHCFKLIYLFSHPFEDAFVFVEHPLTAPQVYTYPSIASYFPEAHVFENEMVDMFGLYPETRTGHPGVQPGGWLHIEYYPPKLHPLRRDQTTAVLRTAIDDYRKVVKLAVTNPTPMDGEWLLPVGPVHAGVIEPGRFFFHTAGEIIEQMDVRLGYTHKGIERLFQTNYALQDGWRLAEHVCGDACFAHSLAYCQAVEALADCDPSPQAQLLRAIFLELERIANHIGDCAALVKDVSFQVGASELEMLRERVLRVNQRLTGHRLLRGLNRPGGILFPCPENLWDAQLEISLITAQYSRLVQALAAHPPFHNRLHGLGILTLQQVLENGTTGLAARASGLPRDFRLLHPTGAYLLPEIQALLSSSLSVSDTHAGRELTAGDALARFLYRAREVECSEKIIQVILRQPAMENLQPDKFSPLTFEADAVYSFGLGCTEGWRGDVVYWIVMDKGGRIFRCKVRDPSMLNWVGVKAAVEPHQLDDDYVRRFDVEGRLTETGLADFPVVNKSFNLSYSANDL